MWTFPTDLPTLLDTLVNLTILGGALVAAYKFRVFDVMGHRYRSEVWCASTPAGEDEPGRILFVGNFIIHNTGDRPLKIREVRLFLIEPCEDDVTIDSDRAREPLLRRKFEADSGTSWLRIGAGERSIYPMRGYVDRVTGPLIFKCEFEWKHRGQPSEFAWLYDPRLPMTWRSEPTQALPEAWDPAQVAAARTRGPRGG